MQQLLFQKKALWIHDYEIHQRSTVERFAVRHFSGVPPLAQHYGILTLTDKELLLEAEDENVGITLSEIKQLYHGFDEYYSSASAKNFGAFWQPIRLNYTGNARLYLIIGYNGIYTANGKFFQLLKELLS